MALFKRDFNKPGPGVPKNAPRKKGFGRFFELLGRDFGNLVKLNLIYAISVLPAEIMLVLTWVGLFSGNTVMFFICGFVSLAAAIPVGPSTTAMYYIISKMLRDDPGFIWHDYKKLFKDNFRSTVIPGIVYALILGSQIFGFLYYTSLQGGIGIAMVAIYLFSVLLMAMAAPYFFTQSAYLDLGTGGRLKNSLLLALGFAPRSFMGALLGSGLLVLQLLLFPLSLIVTIFIGYTIPCLLCLLWIWPPLDKTFKIEATLIKRAKGEDGEETGELDGIEAAEEDFEEGSEPRSEGAVEDDEEGNYEEDDAAPEEDE